MDSRRFLMPILAACSLSGCALFRGETADAVTVGAMELVAAAADLPPTAASMPDVGAAEPPPVASPVAPSETRAARGPAASDDEARTVSAQDGFVGAVRVFAWSPGRVYEVQTAPLRVTTLTLAPGETLVSRAAGDTVRWQIGETTSGEGTARRSHLLIKPLQRGLDTNLVLTTSRRVILVELRSGGVEAFNAAVVWDAEGLDAPPAEPVATAATTGPIVGSDAILDARYAIEARGRRPRWSPTSVFNDGVRTFITFGRDLQIGEAPALFVVEPDGAIALVNYRQAGGLYIVDRIFDQAELRLGDRRPQIVRLRRLGETAR